MYVKEVLQTANGFPAPLQQIPTPPTRLFIAGENLPKLLQQPRVAIVGSRKVSAYGRGVTATLAGELAHQGVVIVSGLAMGVDALAHRAALEAGGFTIAVLPCGLDHIYPAAHQQLAQDIIKQDGALVTEYPAGSIPYKLNFVERNRLVSGLSDAVLITEAAERSGTLHTADFAIQQGRDVLAVPGNITSPTSKGTNNLIKGGATPVTSATDVLYALGLKPAAKPQAARSSDPQEQLLLDLIMDGTKDGAALLTASQLDTSLFNQTLTMLEITSKIRALGNNQWEVY